MRVCCRPEFSDFDDSSINSGVQKGQGCEGKDSSHKEDRPVKVVVDVILVVPEVKQK